MPDRFITLEISEDASARTYNHHISLDGTSVVNNKPLSLSQSDHIRDIGATYEALFLSSGPTLSAAILVNARLEAMGTELFATWLEPHWQELAINPGDRRILTIASEVPDVLNLPWELLNPPDGGEIGTDLGWGIRRIPQLNLKPKNGGLAPGKLRVLFAACSPANLKPELDYEREEELLSGAVGTDTRLDIAILGTFDELMDRVESFEPHIVHLSGHGTADKDGAKFHFEDGPQFARDLGQRFAGSGVKCVFVSGCQSGRAPARDVAAGLCQAIVSEGVPMAVGWGAPIDDETATLVAERFYRTAATGRDVDYALARARAKGKAVVGGRGDASWSLPVLYATTADTLLFDNKADPVGGAPKNDELRALPGMLQGYARNLIGRRRELQALLPRILHPNDLRGVVITGMGGSGKSSLATRLARKLEAEVKLTPIPISAGNRPITAQAIVDACAKAFLGKGLAGPHQRATNKDLPMSEKLGVLVDDLKDDFVLVFDNLENSMDEATRVIRESEVSDFYVQLLNGLIGSSRFIVTSRYLPAAVDPLPDDVAERSIGDFSDTAFLKFMYRDVIIKQKYRADMERRKVLSFLHSRLGGIPLLARQVRQDLKTINADALQNEINDNDAAAGANKLLGDLDNKHAKFCDDVFIARQHGRLNTDARKLLICMAAHIDPISAEGLATISRLAVSEVEAALKALCRAALAHGDSHPDNPAYSVSGTLRRWLVGPSPRCSAVDWQDARREAANYLVELDIEDSGGKFVRTDISRLLRARALYLTTGEIELARKVNYRLSEILTRRGDHAEVERLNQEFVNFGRQDEKNFHPDHLTWIARAHFERTDYPKAQDWYQQAFDASEKFPLEHADALQGLASVDLRHGSTDSAGERFRAALKIQQSTGDLLGQSLSWHQLGSIAMSRGDHVTARSNFTTALDLIQQLRAKREPPPDPIKLEQAQEGEQAILHQFGSMELEEGNLDKAKITLGNEWIVAQQIGDRAAEAAAIHQLGRIEAKLNNFDDARKKFKNALEIRWSIGDRAGEKKTFTRIGEMAAQLGQHDLQLQLEIIAYVISKKAIESEAEADLGRVKQLAQALPMTADELDLTIAEVEQKYLSDRGRWLLRQVDALRGPIPLS